MDTVIELKNISKMFKNRELYKQINLSIKKGECIGFVGANGVGKSVLFQMIAGLIEPSEGEVIVNGKIVGGKERDFPENMGILINSPGYIEYYSGYKNLLMLAEIKNVINEKRVQETMEVVGLDWKDKTPVKKYSMGMKQKLGIAQAIMEYQDILVLDEPYNALDFKTNKDITVLLETLKKAGKTILLTSHQHSFLEKLCDRMYCIEQNQIYLFDEEFKKKYFEV